MIYLVMALGFFTAFFFLIGIYLLVFENRIVTLRRLENSYSEKMSDYDYEANQSPKAQGLGVLDLLVKMIPQKSYIEKIRIKLLQSYIKMKPEEFIGISVISAIVFGMMLYLVSKTSLVSIIGMLLGYKIPDLFLNSTKKKRGRDLNRQLPQALLAISNGLRAGFSFPQAMGVASKELEAPLADEFKKVLRDNSLGKPMEEALDNLGKRNDDEDLDMVITALQIQRQVGGNLAEVLDTISETIRERVKLRGEVRALTAQGRMSAVIISLLPIGIALALSVINPQYIGVLFTTTLGLIMVAMSSVSLLIGVFVLAKMVDLKV